MKYLFALWAAPLVVFWGWFYLRFTTCSAMSSCRAQGTIWFPALRELLGIEPEIIPPMVARLAYLTVVICAIWAFRRRRELSAWAAPLARYFARTPSQRLSRHQPTDGPAGRSEACRARLAG